MWVFSLTLVFPIGEIVTCLWTQHLGDVTVLFFLNYVHKRKSDLSQSPGHRWCDYSVWSLPAGSLWHILGPSPNNVDLLFFLGLIHSEDCNTLLGPVFIWYDFPLILLARVIEHLGGPASSLCKSPFFPEPNPQEGISMYFWTFHLGDVTLLPGPFPQELLWRIARTGT